MRYIRTFILLIGLMTGSGFLFAQSRIAILDFELKDITSLPNTKEEIIRTGSMKSLLEQALSLKGDYEFIQVSLSAYKAANAGPEYLYKFHDIAAQLGADFSADWVVVGQHSKPSFLYSYLLAHVVNVKSGKLMGRYEVELKGNHEKVTRRGLAKLAKQISAIIDQYH